MFLFHLRMSVKLLTLPRVRRLVFDCRASNVRKRNDAQTHICIPYQFIFLSTNPSCSTDFFLASSSVWILSCRITLFLSALFFVRSWVFYLLFLFMVFFSLKCVVLPNALYYARHIRFIFFFGCAKMLTAPIH